MMGVDLIMCLDGGSRCAMICVHEKYERRSPPVED